MRINYFEDDYTVTRYKNGTLEKLNLKNGLRIIKNPYCFDFKIITFLNKLLLIQLNCDQVSL